MEFSGVDYQVIIKDGQIFISLPALLNYLLVNGLDEFVELVSGLQSYIGFDVEVQRLIEETAP
jgi:hypothetical protein